MRAGRSGFTPQTRQKSHFFTSGRRSRVKHGLVVTADTALLHKVCGNGDEGGAYESWTPQSHRCTIKDIKEQLSVRGVALGRAKEKSVLLTLWETNSLLPDKRPAVFVRPAPAFAAPVLQPGAVCGEVGEVAGRTKCRTSNSTSCCERNK
jgi:hypothetical protein